MKFKTLLLFVSVVVLMFLYFFYDQLVMPFKIGAPAPVFSIQNLEGKQVNLVDFKGSPVLVHFWATWCSICEAEMPVLNTLSKVHPNLKILAISVDKDVDSIKKFFGNNYPEFEILFDAGGKVSDLYKSYKVPESYLLDKEGRILKRFVGPIDPDEIDVNL